MKLNFKVLEGKYCVCRLGKNSIVPAWAYRGEFYSATKTPDEVSIVCLQEDIPEDIKCEKDWRILRVEGVLDFSLTGILASISTKLANAGISIFAISTYDTDYILVKDINLNQALKVLKQ